MGKRCKTIQIQSPGGIQSSQAEGRPNSDWSLPSSEASRLDPVWPKQSLPRQSLQFLSLCVDETEAQEKYSQLQTLQSCNFQASLLGV